MGGPLGIVHVTTLNGSVARLVSCRERTRGRASSSWGARPIRLPSRPSKGRADAVAVVAFTAVCSPLFCCMSGGYAPPLGVAPCFLIVYAPAMRRVAYYALGWGCSCARLAVWRCRASRVVVCGVAAHVCACGPFVVPLGRERGAQVSHLCSFSRMLRRPSVARCIKGATGSPMGVIERVKRYGITG